MQSRAPLVMSPPDKPLMKQHAISSSASSSTFSLLSTTGANSSNFNSQIGSNHSGGSSSPAQLSATLRNSVKSVSSMHSSALKLFGTSSLMGDVKSSQSASGNHSSHHQHGDEGDLKVDASLTTVYAIL